MLSDQLERIEIPLIFGQSIPKKNIFKKIVQSYNCIYICNHLVAL